MWIDAVCIDQSAIPERSHQVTLMSEIYSKATRAIVYLGEAEADSDLAMDYILDIDTAESNSSLTFPKSDTLANAVNNLFRRPWFNRVWVVQKIVFASQATVICGTKALGWHSFKNFRHHARWTAWIDELPFVVSVSVSGGIEEDYSPFGPSEPLTVLEQLKRARHCRATDPRDKIYALLPFLRANKFNAGVVPNYNKSTAQAFTECAAELIFQSGFDVLRAVESLSNDESLPSWVPDWSLPPMRSDLDRPLWQRASYVSGADPYMHHVRVLDNGATNAHPHSIKSKVRTPTLQAFGHCDGHVTHLGSSYVAGQGPFPLDEWRAVFASALGSEFSDVDQRAFSCTIGDERFMRQFVDMEAEREHDDNLNDSWCQVVRRLADSRRMDNLPLPYKDIPFHLAAYGFIATAKGIVRETLQMCHNRRFFVTNSGVIGLGPTHLQLGDGLYRCLGADDTFAFREEDTPGGERAKRVKLIGVCFVASLSEMDSAAGNGRSVSEVPDCLHIA